MAYSKYLNSTFKQIQKKKLQTKNLGEKKKKNRKKKEKNENGTNAVHRAAPLHTNYFGIK